MNQATKILIDRVGEPSDGDAFNTWVALGDATDLLKADLGQDDIWLYCSIGDIFINGVLVPSEGVMLPDAADLMKWQENPDSSWGKAYSLNPPKVRIEPPLAGSPSKTIAQGEQLVFARRFEGVSDETSIELLQKLAHVFGLHCVEYRSAYCRLDGRGDLEDVVSITRIEDAAACLENGVVVTIRRAAIDEYMAITDTSMVRMFDITRFSPRGFGGWARDQEATLTTDGDLIYRRHVEPKYASYMRGVQIVRSRISKESAAERYWFRRSDRKYESFTAVDWKNGIIRKISTEPGQTANYFTQSDLPFEMSPAFFHPEVLMRYKSDSDKYTLRDRSISCRGAWHLQTYDINDAGQVQTYIVYLRNLPYAEQLYWKAHNERPKAQISKRAVRTDFEGNWKSEYDPLQSLRQVVQQLNEKTPPWWIQRPAKVVERAHYPVTASPDEWADEILRLDQLVIEGLSGTELRSLATSQGRTPNAEFGSLKLVEECLMGLGWEEEQAREVTEPLHRLHYYRSKTKAHSRGKEGEQIRKEVLQTYRSYERHFKVLSTECDGALRTIAIALSPGTVASA